MGEKAMLKVATAAGEKTGAGLMRWWNGRGAAKVFAQLDDAILIERAIGDRSLIEMAEHDRDDEATAIACSVVMRLHEARARALPKLAPLADWFIPLLECMRDGAFTASAYAAEYVLKEPRDVCPLHGDIHHANILDFGCDWLAIDPKGVIGERTFDYANLFCNPNLRMATAAGRLERQLQVVCRTAGLDEIRLLYWVLAWTGLSARWLIEDGFEEQVQPTLQVAEIAASAIMSRGRIVRS